MSKVILQSWLDLLVLLWKAKLKVFRGFREQIHVFPCFSLSVEGNILIFMIFSHFAFEFGLITTETSSRIDHIVTYVLLRIYL